MSHPERSEFVCYVLVLIFTLALSTLCVACWQFFFPFFGGKVVIGTLKWKGVIGQLQIIKIHAWLRG